MRILLVEDDDSIAVIVEMILKREGFALKRVPDAEAALCVERDFAPHLLIADMSLPGAMNGLVLAQRLKGARPELGVIVTSGLFEEGQDIPDLPDRAVLLPKPFRRDALLKAVSEAREKLGG